MYSINDTTYAESQTALSKLIDKHAPKENELSKAGFMSPKQVREALIRNGCKYPAVSISQSIK